MHFQQARYITSATRLHVSLYMQGLVVSAHGELFHFFLRGCVHSHVNVGGCGHKRKTLGAGSTFYSEAGSLVYYHTDQASCPESFWGFSCLSFPFLTGVRGMWRYAPPCPVLCGLWGFEPGLHADSINTLLSHLLILLLSGFSRDCTESKMKGKIKFRCENLYFYCYELLAENFYFPQGSQARIPKCMNDTLALLKSTDVGPGEIVLLRKCCTQGRGPRSEPCKQINKKPSPEVRHAGAYLQSQHQGGGSGGRRGLDGNGEDQHDMTPRAQWTNRQHSLLGEFQSGKRLVKTKRNKKGGWCLRTSAHNPHTQPGSGTLD